MEGKDFKDGFAIVYKEGKAGLINKKDEVVVPCNYDDIIFDDIYILANFISIDLNWISDYYDKTTGEKIATLNYKNNEIQISKDGSKEFGVIRILNKDKLFIKHPYTMTLQIDSPFIKVNNNDVIRLDRNDDNVTPILYNEKTYVPLRILADILGFETSWDEVEQKITIKNEDKEVNIWLNSDRILVNGEETQIDMPPFVLNDRTMVPLRFIAETLDCEVNWNEDTNEIIIKYDRE